MSWKLKEEYPYSSCKISFSFRLKGVIKDGRAGMKLSFSINDKKVSFDLYFIFNDLVFQFYVRLKIEINLVFVDFEYEFYLFKAELLI